MREIKFRGIDMGGNFRYGHLLTRDIDTGCVYIRVMNPENVPPRYSDYQVEPDTVGQYTGLKDRYEEDIYEGDVLRYEWSLGKYHIGEVVFSFNTGVRCVIKSDLGTESWLPIHTRSVEIIGNLHENPELIKTAMT